MCELVDAIRADGRSTFRPRRPPDLFWAYDKHFGQAYGLVAEGHTILWPRRGNACSAIATRTARSPSGWRPGSRTAWPGESFPVRTCSTSSGLAARLAGKSRRSPADLGQGHRGQPVAGADVVLEQAGKRQAWGRTDDEGQIARRPRRGPGTLTVSAIGSGIEEPFPSTGPAVIARTRSSCPRRRRVAARITDEQGRTIPCKVQFIGRDGTQEPRLRSRHRRARGQERLLQPRRPIPPARWTRAPTT